MVTHRLLLAALSRLCSQVHLSVFLFSGEDLGVELEFESLLGQRPLKLFAIPILSAPHPERCKNERDLRDLLINSNTTDTTKELNNRHLSAQSAPNTAHLKTNNTTTNNNHLSWHLLQI